MHSFSTLLIAALAAVSFALPHGPEGSYPKQQEQQGGSTKPFTDPATGITFQTYTSKKNSKFGFALSKDGGSDLIGFLSAPKGFTYAGGVLGPAMNGTVLLTAWPNGKDMIGSIRKVPDGAPPHAAPPELTSNIAMKTISKGSFVADNGDWQYTFLCTGCLERKDVYPASAAKSTDRWAWALSNDPMADPSKRDGPLHHHHAGAGMFTADVAGAKSDKYAEWAKMAM